jgi:acyl-CoA-binding protein
MENIEELQLKVKELLYKNDLDVLLKVTEKLKYEKIEELKEKSRSQVINLVEMRKLLNDVF